MSSNRVAVRCRRRLDTARPWVAPLITILKLVNSGNPRWRNNGYLFSLQKLRLAREFGISHGNPDMELIAGSIKRFVLIASDKCSSITKRSHHIAIRHELPNDCPYVFRTASWVLGMWKSKMGFRPTILLRKGPFVGHWRSGE